MKSSQAIRDRGDLEKAMNRALRDNLALLQRSTEELSHAVADLVSACASSRTVNALPSLLRAQTSAASLAAALEVLAKFVTAAAQAEAFPEGREQKVSAVAIEPPTLAPEPVMPPPSVPTPMAGYEPAEPALEHGSLDHGGIELGEPITPEVPPPMAPELEPIPEPVAEPVVEPVLEAPLETSVVAPPIEFPAESAEAAAARIEALPFDLASLPLEEQELHRRANRVAKVSMQDIQLMRPDEVRIGREQRDLCRRLRRDLDKARKEYERRFGSILNQPVDYFHYWVVELLANGDPEALGEYPYPSPVLHH